MQWPRGSTQQRIAILEAAISGVELTLVEAYANQEPADVALCEQRLDELNVELDRLIPRQRRAES